MLRIALPCILVAGVVTVGCADDTTSGSGTDGSSTGAPATSSDATSVGESSSSGPLADDTGTTGTPADGSTTSDDGGTTSTGSTGGSESSGTTTGAVAEICDYPIVWTADAQAETDAQTVLDVLAPEALLSWNEDRGTFSSIQDLEVVIDCPDNDGVLEAAFAFAELHPDLFQLEADEWFLGDGNTQCQHIDDPTPSTFNTSRRTFDNLDVLHDVIAYRLYRNEADEVVLASVNGTYLPVMPDEVRDQVLDCVDNGASVDLLETTVRGEAYDYLTYLDSQQFCEPSGSGTYQPQDDDTVNFTADGLIQWSESGAGTATLTLARRIEVVVHPDNVTDALAASNAVCPEPMGPGQIVGFAVLIDAVEAIVEGASAGLGCIVC